MKRLNGCWLVQLDHRLAEDGLRDDRKDLGGGVLSNAPVDNPSYRIGVNRVVPADAGATFENTLN